MKTARKTMQDDLHPFIAESLYGKSTLLSVAYLRKHLNIGVNRSKRILSRLAADQSFVVDQVGEDFYVLTDKRMECFLQRARNDAIVQAKKIQQHLARFEAWSNQFEQNCLKAIQNNDLTFDGIAFANGSCHAVIYSLLKALECGHVYLDDQSLAVGRGHAVATKIDFFKHYLMVALLENQPEIKRDFEFLKPQHPSKIKNNMSFWFGCHPERTMSGSYSDFDGNSVMLFSPDRYSMDFQRIRNILPYDRICIRRKGGKVWSSKKIKKTAKKIRTDLCLSQKDFDVSMDDDLNILTLNFDASFPTQMVY